MSALDVTNLFPWKDIRDVTVDGEEMVFIPKVYVKNTVIGGFSAWYICGTQKEGYHLHPAFYNKGTPTQNGILVAKYLSSGSNANLHSVRNEKYVSLSYSSAKSSAEAKNIQDGTSDQTGWHLYNIYEHHLLYRLALIEYGAPNFTVIYGGQSLSFDYHGIVDSSGYIWPDGLRAYVQYTSNIPDKYVWCILNKTQSEEIMTEVDIGCFYNSSYSETIGYPLSFINDVGIDYDFGDIFLAGSLMRDYEEKSLLKLNSSQSVTRRTTTGYNNFAVTRGFGVTLTISNNTTNSYYCRLAKFC